MPVDGLLNNDGFTGATADSAARGNQEALTASSPSISSRPEATATSIASVAHGNAEDSNDSIDVSNGKKQKTSAARARVSSP